MGICFLWANILGIKISTDGFHSRSLVLKRAMTFVGHPRLHYYADGQVAHLYIHLYAGLWDLNAHFIIWQAESLENVHDLKYWSWRAGVLPSLALTCFNTPAWKLEVYLVRPWLAASGVLFRVGAKVPPGLILVTPDLEVCSHS